MKNKNNKTNKMASALNYFSALCFYIVSILNFLDKDTSTGIMYLCLGSTFLCLGSINFNTNKKKK